jgi:hypothetical protein
MDHPVVKWTLNPRPGQRQWMESEAKGCWKIFEPMCGLSLATKLRRKTPPPLTEKKLFKLFKIPWHVVVALTVLI